MAVTASKLIETAAADIGYCESPAGSNRTKYGKWYGMDGAPWCMMAVQYWCNKAGVLVPLKTASCTAFMNAAKAQRRWVTSGYRPGDIILYQFDNMPDADHVGICESVSGSTVTCIEGNTSVTSNDNGGKVMRRTRKLSLVLGAYRPKYAAETNTTAGGTCTVTVKTLQAGNSGSQVKALQILLNGYGYNCGAADGDFGSKTLAAVKKYQTAKGLIIDGIVGAKTWAKLIG